MLERPRLRPGGRSRSLRGAPITPNPSHNDYSYDLVLRLRLPDNAKLRQYRLTGGDTPATATLDGDELVLRAPGPFPAAVAFQLPTVKLTLKATTRGSVTTEPGGSGYDTYGFGWDFIPSANEAPHVPAHQHPAVLPPILPRH